MRYGEWVELVTIWTLRFAIALLMLPMILVYAATACVGCLGARAISAVRPAARRPAPAPVPA